VHAFKNAPTVTWSGLMGQIYDEFMTHFCFVKISLINELCFGLLGRNDPGVCILASQKSVIFCCEKNYYNKLILNKV